MKQQLTLIIAICLLIGSCVKKQEELPYNIFEDEEAQLFSITGYNQNSTNSAKVQFETNFDILDYPSIDSYWIRYVNHNGEPDLSICHTPRGVKEFWMFGFDADFDYCFEFQAKTVDYKKSRVDLPICPDW